MQNVESAVIAAAGLGSRIGLGMPKCMIEIEGVTILSRLIAALRPHVSSIQLVIGYREEMIIEYCARNHRDVVLIRNPDYRTTNTAYSLSKGARHLTGKTVFLDGDLIISPDSLAAFLKAAQHEEVLVGLTDAKSDDAVFVDGEKSGDLFSIREFTRTKKGSLEWANLVVGPSTLMDGANGYVFERLADSLPLNGYVLELAEVDTASDLNVAKNFAKHLPR